MPLVCPDEVPVPPVPLEGEPLLVVEADHLLHLALAVALQAGKGQHLGGDIVLFEIKIK